MISKITLKGQIGKGGYSNVYKCLIPSNTSFSAAKCMNMDSNGELPVYCLSECVFMSTVSHTFINSAISIGLTEYKVFCIQDLAVCDLSQWRHNNIKIDSNQMKIWLFQVASALQYLHQQEIIHGDVKASNVLLYSNNTIKLTDFSLMIKNTWIKNGTHVCTSTHRPLEAWIGSNWDFSVDIWSYGCLIHELLFNKHLFNTISDENAYSQIKSWKFINNEQLTQDLNDLLKNVLCVHPDDRLTIHQIINHKYFSDLIHTSNNTQSSSPIKTFSENPPINRNNYKLPKFMHKHVIHLHTQIKTLNTIPDEHKLLTCVSIYQKLYFRKSLFEKVNDPSFKINFPKYEKLVLKHVSFKLQL